jgi:excisionase family DNA binding protein
MPDPLLTTAEAAAHLHLSVREVQRLAGAGILRSTREMVGPRLEYRFSLPDLDAYVPAPQGNRTGKPRRKAPSP